MDSLYLKEYEKEPDENVGIHFEILHYQKYISDTISLVDPVWENIDPIPDIYAMFQAYDNRFFQGKLCSVELKWSPRMYTCAGICVYQGRGGLCSIRLSEALLKFRPRKDLVETLLHEMIHAFLFITSRDFDREGHGPNFQHHMHRINKEAGTKITIYHSFHDEVRNYKVHWWRCNGPCQDRKPFFGWVKRTMNRAPGPNDTWWKLHKQSCNGEFIKVKEPENFNQKTRRKAADSGQIQANVKRKLQKTNEDSSQVDIRKFLSPTKTQASNSNFPHLSIVSSPVSGLGEKNKKDSEDSTQVEIRTFSSPTKAQSSSHLIDSKSIDAINSLAAKKKRIPKIKNDPSQLDIRKFLSPKKSHATISYSISSISGLPIVPFSGTGQTLGSKSNKEDQRNIFLDLLSSENLSTKTSNTSESEPLVTTYPTSAISGLPVIPFSGSGQNLGGISSSEKTRDIPVNPQFVDCPSCILRVPFAELNIHLDTCLS
ncbi:hypothetical protein Ciccas_000635 [Cichlidogyrus casuarinus]|uniref:Protein with SprT-like domain at the N terminus n=1 Tax=Cichlidogyrus casuarinus TaxID=1844966 RepID=A0ABD2QMD0_9PLAT